MTVRCVRCDAGIRLEHADLVGNGYRCPACSIAATSEEACGGLPDLADHLDPAARDAQRAKFRDRAIIAGGVVVATIAAPIAAAMSGLASVALGLFAVMVPYGITFSSVHFAVAYSQYRRYAKQPQLPAAIATIR